MKVGTKVIVYDRYQQAVPVSGEVVEVRKEHPPGVKVRLHTTNNPLKPIGTEEWFFAEQLREAPVSELDVLRVENSALKDEVIKSREERDSARKVLGNVRGALGAAPDIDLEKFASALRQCHDRYARLLNEINEKTFGVPKP